MKYKDRVKKMPLIPNYGNEDFHINLSLELLRKKVSDNYYPQGQIGFGGGFFLHQVTFFDCITFNIDVMESRIKSIDFSNDYRGAYKGVFLGNTVDNLLGDFTPLEDLFYEEYYITIGEKGKPISFILEIDNEQETIWSLDSIKGNVITKITFLNWNKKV